MNEMVSSQAVLFITSVEVGILVGACFDLTRIARKLIKHPAFFVQLEDLLFWIISGLLGFYMLYVCNYADIRSFVFVGMILGAIFYFASFSIIFMKIATIVINYIKATVKYIWRLVMIPVNALIKFIKIPMAYLRNKKAKLSAEAKARQRIKRRIKYQEQADQKTEKYIQETFKKINLENKAQEKEKEKRQKQEQKLRASK